MSRLAPWPGVTYVENRISFLSTVGQLLSIPATSGASGNFETHTRLKFASLWIALGALRFSITIFLSPILSLCSLVSSLFVSPRTL